MRTKTFLAGATLTIVGFLLMAVFFAGYLPDYSFNAIIIIAAAGMILWGAGEGLSFKPPKKYKRVINPMLFTVIWNLMVVGFFILMDRQLFEDFVQNFGLSGSWSLFTLNMQANIGGTVKTYPYFNATFGIFLLCVVGNIVLSAVYLTRIYRDKEGASQQIPQSPPPPE
jgi:hypothetical protein